MPGKWLTTEVLAINGSGATSYTYTLNDYEGYCITGYRATVTLGAATGVAMYLQSKHPLEGGYQTILEEGGDYALGFTLAADVDTLRLGGLQVSIGQWWPIPPNTSLVVDMDGIGTTGAAHALLFLAKPFGG